MKRIFRSFIYWFIMIFGMPIYAVFLFTATACYFIADKIEDLFILLCDGKSAYEQHKIEKRLYGRVIM